MGAAFNAYFRALFGSNVRLVSRKYKGASVGEFLVDVNVPDYDDAVFSELVLVDTPPS